MGHEQFASIIAFPTPNRGHVAITFKNQPTPKRTMSQHSIYITFQNRPRFHLRTWGSAVDACVLIHGFGEGSYVWNEFAPLVSSHYRTFAVDLCGHGDSEWDCLENYNIKSYVSDVVNVLRALNCKNIVLVGHSMGADIAIRAALERPECIVGLVLVDFGPVLNSDGLQRVHEDFRAGNRIYSSILEYTTWLAERRPLIQADVLRRIASCALLPRPDGTFQRKVDPSMLLSAHERCECKRDGSDLWNYLKQMRWPVLVVRGEGSAVLTRRVAEQMRAALPNGHLRVVKQAGHDVMSDNPAGFLEAVLPFLRALQTGI
jgi:pimeloyl-ACP methyl ester carboxylesterase